LWFAQVLNMYAIVQVSGRQQRVTPGGWLTVDGTAGEPGGELSFDQVLLVEKDGGEVVAGAPFVAGARVVAVIEGETRGPKLRVFKKKRRKGMRRTKGHRSTFTRLRVRDILA
jgi:large subunit ribosomal protein L21